MANHVVGLSKRMVVSTGRGATKDMGAAHQVARRYAHLSPTNGSGAISHTESGAKYSSSKATAHISSPNNSDRIESTVSEHHPYKSRGGAFDTNKRMYQGDAAKRSRFTTPSGGGTGKVGNRKVSEQRKPDNYNDPMKENHTPAEVGSKGNPSGPKGGIRAVMNRMAR